MEELYDIGDDKLYSYPYLGSPSEYDKVEDILKEYQRQLLEIKTRTLSYEFTSIFKECTLDLSDSVMTVALEYCDYTKKTCDNLAEIKYTVTASKNNSFVVQDIIEYLSKENEVMFKVGEVTMDKNQISQFFNKWLLTSFEILEDLN